MKAISKNIKISPQKARLVADQIRGKKIDESFNILKHSNKKAATIILKTLNSAINNAENNFGEDIDTLKIREICVDKGMVLKRFHARARGRGAKILKRYSHIKIQLGVI